MDKNEAVQTLTDANYAADDANYRLKTAVVKASLAGASWAEIAAVLGTSKQTAYNRYKENVASEQRHQAWAAANPEQHAAAVARGVAEAKRELAEIRERHHGKTQQIRCTLCTWTVAYPQHEEEDALMDLEDHMNSTHADEAYGYLEDEQRAAMDQETPAKNLDAQAPANSVTTITGITVGPPHVEEWTDPRPGLVLKSAGMIDGVAQPGTGKGPHQCRRCGSNNHKSGRPDVVVAYADCGPTKYDPQDITDYLNTTGLSRKA